MEITNKKDRPVFDDEIRKELANIVGKKVYEWCEHETELEDCIDSSYKILRNYHSEDGYELAKEFEDEGYGSDSALVEELDGVYHLKYNLLHNAIKKWVIEENIQPEFKENDVVIVKYRLKNVEGIITEIHKEDATYRVCIPSEGMRIDDTRRAVINYEDVKLK